MRPAFIQSLIQIAEKDDGVFLLVGDIGFNLVEPYARKYADRFINVGVAEQNLIGIATGLALSGKQVFVYSISGFPVFRCLEQIRDDVCAHQANVIVVTAGAGLVYGTLGMTHHVTEDIAVMRALPGMTVISPADPIEAAMATFALAARGGPGYLRLARSGDPVIHQSPPDFKIGKAIQLREGSDVTLLAAGGITANVMAAADRLVTHGVAARVASMHSIKPIDREYIVNSAKATGLICTIEEHNVIGGLGGAVAEVLAEMPGDRARLVRLGINDMYCSEVGTQNYLLDRLALSADGIVNQVLSLVAGS